jgi:peptide/nickel transport system permease protein
MLIILLITTLVLYAVMMFTPVETRVQLFMPEKVSPHWTQEQYDALVQKKIVENHLNDPYLVQYFYWLKNLLKGDLGYSPTMDESVLNAIIRRTPVTAELTLYSILAFVPLGLLSGVIAGSKKNKLADYNFRFLAYLATSLPPFILALVLLSFFYVGLKWFPPGRLSDAVNPLVMSENFHQWTGLLTIDGLLNGRPDISLDALRHLVLPVFTLALYHWATLGRITRAAMIDVQHQDYVVAARSRGAPESRITWQHMLPNAITPGISSIALSSASLITGVFVIEIVYNFHGVSEVALQSLQFIPDAQAALGFTLFSVSVVLLLMLVLDLVQTLLDPRLSHKREIL